MLENMLDLTVDSIHLVLTVRVRYWGNNFFVKKQTSGLIGDFDRVSGINALIDGQI